YAGDNVTIDLTTVVDDTDFTNQLVTGFGSAIGAIDVTGSGTAEDPWTVTVTGFGATTELTVAYGFAGADFEELGASAPGSYHTVEKLNAAGEWQLLPVSDTNSQLFVGSTTQSNASSELYISAHKTINVEGPRMIERDVWAENADGVLEKTGDTDWFLDPKYVNDNSVDSITIAGSDANDSFIIGHLVDGEGDPDQVIYTDTMQIDHQRIGDDSRQLSIVIRGLDLDNNLDDPDDESGSGIHDRVTVTAGKGNDELIAGFLPNSTEIVSTQILTAHVVDDLTLIGGEGDDRIVGSIKGDTIDSGTGNDLVTGNAGVDTFIDASAPTETDTLLEARDLNFSLTDSQLNITGQEELLGDVSDIDELEDVQIFEAFEMYGGAGANSFDIDDFTKQALLDGTV
ncbi:MAG: hypothetical protein VXZ35_00490, partial [Pseudomonadota bacterium]|nr:hypothetical protein [Pseudomonadota bacterium]